VPVSDAASRKAGSRHTPVYADSMPQFSVKKGDEDMAALYYLVALLH
jgi:hypothetical protein